MSNADLIKQAKCAAAEQAVEDAEVKNGQVIGIGSGSTVVFVVEELAMQVEEIKKAFTSDEKLTMQFVPTSFQVKVYFLFVIFCLF